MDPTGQLLLIDIAVILIAVCIIDPNVLNAINLAILAVPLRLEQSSFSVSIRIRLWFDRQALFHRGPIGRVWNSYCLWRIRTNPAYREFFQDRE
jgi:hypothetical protein